MCLLFDDEQRVFKFVLSPVDNRPSFRISDASTLNIIDIVEIT